MLSTDRKCSNPPWASGTRFKNVENARAETQAAETQWRQDLEQGLPLSLHAASSVRQTRSMRQESQGRLLQRNKTAAWLAGSGSTPDLQGRRGSNRSRTDEGEVTKSQEKLKQQQQTAYEALLLDVLSKKTSQSFASEQEEEEITHRAVSMPELDPELRVRALACYAKLLGRPGRDASRAEILDFEAGLVKADRQLFMRQPAIAFELSLACRDCLGMASMADSICSQLTETAHKLAPSLQHPMRYILVDLAEWRQSSGETVEARRLFHLACAMPERARDPRTFTRHYAWRFDAEPAVPGVPEKKIDICRPLLGPERHCPCCRGPPDNKNCHSRFSKGTGSKVDKTETDDAIHSQVCGELLSRFNISGSLAQMALCNKGPASGFERMAAAKAAAQKLVYSRRFQVRVVDHSDADDGIAESLRMSMQKNHELRTRAMTLESCSKIAISQSESNNPSEDACTSDGTSSHSSDSDRWFRSQNLESRSSKDSVSISEKDDTVQEFSQSDEARQDEMETNT